MLIRRTNIRNFNGSAQPFSTVIHPLIARDSSGYKALHSRGFCRYFLSLLPVKYSWNIQEEEGYQEILPELLQACGSINKWQLHGEMGAGKTTFVTQLGLFLGLTGMSSPTFSIVNSYEMETDYPPFEKGLIHHMDLYRLETEAELLDIGWEEYVYSSDGLIVEWPQLARPHWPHPFAEIHIQETAERTKRELILILPT